METDKNQADKKNWMRYTALGAEIFAFMALGVFGGLKLDEWLQSKPVFLIILPALALILVCVQIYRQLTNNQ